MIYQAEQKARAARRCVLRGASVDMTWVKGPVERGGIYVCRKGLGDGYGGFKRCGAGVIVLVKN
jgi:hypothetical protein